MAMRRTQSKTKRLPKPLLDAVNKAIAKQHFTYDDLTRLIAEAVRDGKIKPDEAPSRSGLHRYGQQYLDKMEQLVMVREQAKVIVNEAGGDGLVMEEAAVNLVLNEIITIMMATDSEKGMKPGDVAKIASGLGKLQQSSVNREKIKTEFKKEAQARAKAVAKDSVKKMKKAGLSGKAIAEIEQNILGIPQK